MQQLLPSRGVEFVLADHGRQRLDRLRVVADVVADVSAERGDDFVEARAAVRFLFGGRHPAVDRGQQQQRQRRDEDEGVKGERAQPAPLRRPIVADKAPYGLARRNDVRGHDGDHAVERQLHRDRQNALTDRLHPPQSRHDQQQQSTSRPDACAGDERRFSSFREDADQHRFEHGEPEQHQRLRGQRPQWRRRR